MKKTWKNPNSALNAPERTTKLSQASKRAWADPNNGIGTAAWREKQSLAAKKRMSCPERRAQKADEMRQKWKEVEYRDKCTAAMKKAWESKELRAHMSAATSERMSNPDVKEHQRQKLQEYWTDERRKERGREISERWADPNSAMHTQEFRDKCREASLRYYADLTNQGNIPNGREQIKPHKRRRWANQVKERDDWTCQECGTTDHLHAHHIKSRFSNPGLAKDIDNGVTLCVVCHAAKHPYMRSLQTAAKRVSEQRDVV